MLHYKLCTQLTFLKLHLSIFPGRGGRGQHGEGHSHARGQHRGGPSHSRGQHGGGHSDTSGDRRERPPPGLRGREIGMWHAARSKRKNREDHDEVGQVTIETGDRPPS